MVAPAFGAMPEHEAAILRILAEYYNETERSEARLARAAEILRDSGDRTLRAQVDCDRGQLPESLGRTEPQAAPGASSSSPPGTCSAPWRAARTCAPATAA